MDIVWENIDDRDSYHNFDKCETEICQIYDDIPYECDSIMHYHDTAFSKDGKVFIAGMFVRKVLKLVSLERVWHVRSLRRNSWTKSRQKVHKHENFFGSDLEFFTFLRLVMPNYYFLETFFFIGSCDQSAHTQYMRKEVFPAS